MIRAKKMKCSFYMLFVCICTISTFLNISVKPAIALETLQHKAYVAGSDMALIRTKEQNIHKFFIETVVTTDDQKKGLMDREHLKEDAGMLFIFAGDSAAAMWMRNTKISLDMLFIASDGRIEHIHANAKPMSDDLILPPLPVRAVLEINAGLAEKLGIKVGDHLDYPMFKLIE